MSEAPERIYLDGDVEAGDGMFPRCFENPKYASEPPVEYIRADIAAAKLATCEKYRDAYAECDRIGTQAVRELEAKLAKAVEIALEECPFRWGTGSWMDWRSERRSTLAALKGDKA